VASAPFDAVRTIGRSDAILAVSEDDACNSDSPRPVTQSAARAIGSRGRRRVHISIRPGPRRRSWGEIRSLALALEEITTNGGVT
jgi:hypothetical protein